MNSKILSLILSLFSLLLVASCSQTKQGMMTFEEMDTDANGYISPAEAKVGQSIGGKFNQVDTNKDGKINIEEYQAYMGKHRMTPPEEMETPEPGAAPY